MAFDLIVYDETKVVTVHTLTCKVFSTVERRFSHGQVVKVEEGWDVRKCVVCMPRVHVVTVEKLSVDSVPSWVERTGFEPWMGETNGQPSRPLYGPPEPPKKRVNHFTKVPGYVPPDSHDANVERRWGAAWRAGLKQWHNDDTLDAQPSHSSDGWQGRGLCSNDGGKLGKWMAWLYQGEHTSRWAVGVMKGICSTCPVRVECLEQGVWGLELWGVWGGATYAERKRLRARWEREGRRDERPDRPHSHNGRSEASPGVGLPYFANGNLRRTDGSGVTDTSRDVNQRVVEASGRNETEDTGMSGVRASWDMQGPGPDEWADDWWSGTGDGNW